MTGNKQSRLFSFRVPANLADEINEAIRRTRKDKSAWVLGAVLKKLDRPDIALSTESCMEGLIGQMEALLSGSKTLSVFDDQPVTISQPTSATPLTVKDVIAQMVEEARQQGIQSSNKRMGARLNELGIRPARGGPWTVSAVNIIKRRLWHFRHKKARARAGYGAVGMKNQAWGGRVSLVLKN